jgi:hypothetical protein
MSESFSLHHVALLPSSNSNIKRRKSRSEEKTTAVSKNCPEIITGCPLPHGFMA